VDASDGPIEEITPNGIRAGGNDFEFDIIVFATGFDAMTAPLTSIKIQGRGGQLLSTKWESGPLTYLGIAVAGFPNLFTITGPGSSSVLTNMPVSIEHHVEWISDCIDYLRRN
jgi:cyclohexanone monooxygenase